MADHDIDDALRSLAGDIQRTGRVLPAADIRRRGDRRRRVHTITAAAAGVLAVGAIATGIAVAQNGGRSNGLPAGPSVAPSAPAASAVPSVAPSAPPTSPSARPQTTTPTSRPPAVSTTPTTGRPDPLLSGRRQLAVVRVQAFESGVTLSDDGRLTEADDDSGSQLFVPVPLDDGTFLVRTADRRENGEAACWRAKNNGSDPLTVVGAPCDTGDAAQKFAITRRGDAWTFANRGAFLQDSSSGFILEELGDAPLETTFRLVDNGAAPD